ncbi:hypothetical protein PPL_09470 [Heterostelium album PN500]|uniref:Uncharacterized protein n=1 Tax=Heterostelium pallidum (strain ATCC 26659 / Pp 5 / PN500) TaxID=670386 RepID=D3BPK1_HETP5|nr:hypothetical protein PPL_09470 [Heterostelium album PN500]EFA76719.1 hypothetical protein PPL_09470 [Heterostelium album PN500]|eukprot:XP_020428851.1 hypothetical protein PPL_09470 [Heterostelium album PN500]
MHGNVPDDIDYINDTPTVQEYKKLKRVMKIMTKFYEGGSATKLQQAEFFEAELKKVTDDEDMIKAQLESLAKFPLHPKRREYEIELNEEREKLVGMKTKFAAKSKEYRDLYVWSNGIVDVTKWLEAGLDDYCVNHLKMDLKITVVPPEQLTREQYTYYKSGLDEITYNLQESQDFFSASLDGRLRQYHNIEKDLIEAQIEVMSKFNTELPRQQHVISELEADLDYVKKNMVEDPAAINKRKKMLEMHSDFFKVLRWYKDKMKVLGDEYGIVETDTRTEEEKLKTAMSTQVEFMANLTPENTPELEELKKMNLH